MSERDTVDKRVREMIARHIWCRPEDICGENLLYPDLGLSGDDARDLLDEIAIGFKISFEGFLVDRRFPTEGDESSALFWIEKVVGKRKSYIPTTVDDLVEFVVKQLSGKESDSV